MDNLIIDSEQLEAVFTPYSEDDEAQLEKIPGAFGNYGTDSWIGVVVDADNEEKALELGQEMLNGMDDVEFSRQIIANAEMSETMIKAQ